MKYKSSIIVLIVMSLISATIECYSYNDLVSLSRNNTVRVIVPGIDSSGTGFFIDSTHIVTCFHVVAKVTIPKQDVIEWQLSDTTVVLNTGESIPATCISIPSQQNPSPLFDDFAVLKLARVPKTGTYGLTFADSKENPEIGSEVIFSGYPLSAPTMLTHKGFVSGLTEDKVCVQAPINKGNSGGALLNSKGQIIGIINEREGGISNELEKIANEKPGGEVGIVTVGSNGKEVRNVGVVDTIGKLITTINTYISPGIGYAKKVNYIEKFLKDTLILKNKNK